MLESAEPRLTRVLRGDPEVWAYIRRRIKFEICRPFKRTAFWYASGQDLDRVDRYHLSYRKTAGRREVSTAMFSPSSDAAVVLGVGQSNIANECDPHGRYEARGEVYNFNFFDGRCYTAKDPLLGASVDGSNPLTRLGDVLLDRGMYRRVLLVPIAHGGTYARDWAPSGMMFPRLQWALERLKACGIQITHVLWQQGEAEARHSDADAQEWMRNFMAVAGAIRAAGVDAPIYVAQCTICCNDPNERIRGAQRAVVDKVAGIFAGPDIDTIGRDGRHDGCHLSADGLQRAAALWCDAIERVGTGERMRDVVCC
ncbi:MAG TPA: sialate O-acetylesterase [Xanthobacteraceae bacterium]|jgi:hypothetical protein|nr:sialate O-acetylesterase [Xanthobacteraceae bacterium]